MFHICMDTQAQVHSCTFAACTVSNHLFAVELSTSLRRIIQCDILRFAKARQDQAGLTLVVSLVSAQDPPVLELKHC